MSIQLITGFTVNNSTPLDNRIVASGSTARNSIPYKYVGMRVFDTSNNRGYYYNGSTFSAEITDQVNGAVGYVPLFTSQNYIGSSGVFQFSTGTEKRIGVGTNNPLGTNTYMQFGGTSLSDDPNWYSGQSLPLNVIKGGNAIIAYNWYLSGFSPAYFNSSKGSSSINFGNDKGDLIISNRAGGGPNMVQTVYFSSANKVGIGSNWSSFNLPAEALDVTGNIKTSGFFKGDGSQITNISYSQLTGTAPGTASYAHLSGTASYAHRSGTASYANLAGTASAITTRTIWGQSFNGTSDITSNMTVSGTLRVNHTTVNPTGIPGSVTMGWTPTQTNINIALFSNTSSIYLYNPSNPTTYSTRIIQFASYTEFISNGLTYFNLNNEGDRLLSFGRNGGGADQILFVMDNSPSNMPGPLGGKGVYIANNLRVNGRISFTPVSMGAAVAVYRNSTTGELQTFASDIRLKENIIEIEQSLSKVTKLRGVYFNWKEDETKEKQIGLIAQEVEEFFPEAVQLNGISDYKTVRYSEMVGLLINAIKEQQLMIEDLTKRIEVLES
jgi:hypothetical protein